MITTPSSEHVVRKTALALGLAAVAVVLACEAPAPTELPEESAAKVEVALPQTAAGIVERAPAPSEGTPLIVVDGVITSRALDDIGALDIQSIEVVKGEAALGLYGERARHGLIQITTKNAAEASATFEAREIPEPPTQR